MAVETRHMTASEFLVLPESNTPHELINGEDIMSPSPVANHQIISMQLTLLLNSLIPDGRLFAAPMDVYFDESNIPQPDLFWISAHSTTAQITQPYIKGAPDLIVEIFSPGTARRDKKEKFQLYEHYGVREYWMVDPIGQFIEMWRQENNHFVLIGVYGPADECVSPLLGKFTLSAIFQF